MSEPTKGQKIILAARQSGKPSALAAMYGAHTVRVLLKRHDSSSVVLTTRLYGKQPSAKDLLGCLRRAVHAWSQTEEGTATLETNHGIFDIGDIDLLQNLESLQRCLLNEGVLSLVLSQDWENGEDLDWNYNTNLFQENANTETYSADTQQGL